MEDSLLSCTTLQFWSDDFAVRPATVWNSCRQEIFPDYENSFFLKYACRLSGLKTVIAGAKAENINHSTVVSFSGRSLGHFNPGAQPPVRNFAVPIRILRAS